MSSPDSAPDYDLLDRLVEEFNDRLRRGERPAVQEFCDRHPDVHYFHSYEMVVTAERQSDYFKDDGRHVHRHAVRYIVSEFLRLYADPSLHMQDVDTSWLTPITKTAPTPTPEPKAARPKAPPRPAWRRAASRVKRTLRGSQPAAKSR